MGGDPMTVSWAERLVSPSPLLNQACARLEALPDSAESGRRMPVWARGGEYLSGCNSANSSAPNSATLAANLGDRLSFSDDDSDDDQAGQPATFTQHRGGRRVVMPTAPPCSRRA